MQMEFVTYLDLPTNQPAINTWNRKRERAMWLNNATGSEDKWRKSTSLIQEKIQTVLAPFECSKICSYLRPK